MYETKLPLHVLDAVERRWAAKLQQEVSAWKDSRVRGGPVRRPPDKKLERVRPQRSPAGVTIVGSQ
ncbi:hypothetical protein [Bradyrhizobium sp. ARR65]|uniref:hypothetical protein n=1 Tax=Bradyrhizobium sp. ARR65 TaxID=1040989 RepID=UPI000AC8D685|nr:hypothetical protein [Bradyrhizobium sp. ARR65]